MKNKLLFALVMLMSVMHSCKTEFPKNIDKPDLINKSSYEAGINTILKKYDVNNAVTAINKISVNNSRSDEFVLVEFDTKNNKNMEFAIQRKFDSQGSLAAETYIYCEGSCTSGEGCGLNFNLTEPKSIECSCSGCRMVYTKNEPQKVTNGNDNQGLILAQESYRKTFKTNTADDVRIKAVMVTENDKVSIQEVTYADSKGKKSSFILVRAKVSGITADGIALVENKDFVVDCTGSCDCRERFFPGSGAIECTCSPCKMDVKEVKVE